MRKWTEAEVEQMVLNGLLAGIGNDERKCRDALFYYAEVSPYEFVMAVGRLKRAGKVRVDDSKSIWKLQG